MFERQPSGLLADSRNGRLSPNAKGRCGKKMKLGWTEMLHSCPILPARAVAPSYGHISGWQLRPLARPCLLTSTLQTQWKGLFPVEDLLGKKSSSIFMCSIYIFCYCCCSIMGSQNFSLDNLLPPGFIPSFGEKTVFLRNSLVRMNSELRQTLPTTRTINHLSQTPSWNRLRTQL